MRALAGGLLLAGAAITGAIANDSTAELGAGGIQLTRTEAVALLREDLFVSADKVTVDYVFRNTSAKDVTYLVAFPLPPIDAIIPEAMNVMLPDGANPNFVDFTVTVDGKAVTPAVDERATALGVNHTEYLRGLGLPLNPIADGLYQRVEALPEATRDAMAERGLVYVDAYSVQPAWRLDTTFYWEQAFPAGTDVAIAHTYKPVVGAGFFVKEMLADATYRAKYCIDDAFARAATKKLDAIAGQNMPYLSERRISYILTTANNWSRPIGDFRLTVDKGSPDALVSFCADNVTKTGPTTFTATAKDFVPERELDVLIVAPFRAE